MTSTKDRLNALAREHGARLGVYYNIGDMCGPFSIVALRRVGKKGNGAIALRELCALADELKAELSLATSRAALVPYFETFGFKANIKYNGGAGANHGLTIFKRHCHALAR
jgi:hypothetical protein